MPRSINGCLLLANKRLSLKTKEQILLYAREEQCYAMNAFVTLPVLFLILAFAGMIVIGFSLGKKRNNKILLSALHDLVDVIKPDDQEFINIGGFVGYHANFSFKEKDIIREIAATITLLPRHAPLYMPISKFVMRNDRLFISLYMRCSPPGEGHLIQKEYADFRGPKITNVYRLYREEMLWGQHVYYLYYDTTLIHHYLTKCIGDIPDPGHIQHIAILPDERKVFIFMIPEEGAVAECLRPVYSLLIRLFRG